MTATGPCSPRSAAHAAFDPYADRVRGFADPLPLRAQSAREARPRRCPRWLLLVFVRDAATPAAFLLLRYAMLLVGVSFTRRLAAVLFLALPVGAR